MAERQAAARARQAASPPTGAPATPPAGTPLAAPPRPVPIPRPAPYRSPPAPNPNTAGSLQPPPRSTVPPSGGYTSPYAPPYGRPPAYSQPRPYSPPAYQPRSFGGSGGGGSGGGGSGLPGGPRPYTTLQPAPYSRPRGPIRSAGIASTPQAPGIAPQSLPAPPDAPLSVSQVAAAGRGRFLWPVRGSVLSGFGAQGLGQRNDGLNIAANVGDSVKAAAGGEVVYAGNQIPGFGNVVLLKHPGGWVTTYANLSQVGVKMRDLIRQGQEIGLAGQTGGVATPQLHFEIGYAANIAEKARPVDPAALLPSR